MNLFFFRISFVQLYVNGNINKVGDILKSLRELPPETIDMDNVYAYGVSVAKEKSCDSSIILLWSPKKLIECEIAYRIAFQDNPDAREDYEKFDEISKLFQERALPLMTYIAVNERIFSFLIKRSIAILILEYLGRTGLFMATEQTLCIF